MASLAYGKELYGPEAGVVPFGMGRAYSAVADDGLSLYYNPAGLALVNKVDFQVLNVRAETGSDVVAIASGSKKVGKSSNVASTLNGYAGQNLEGQIAEYTQITVPNFAMGLNYNVHLDLDMENVVNPVSQMRYTKDLAFSVGTAFSAGKRKELRVGVVFRWIHRTGGYRTVGIDEIVGSTNSLIDKFGATGSGYSGTVGTQYVLPFSGRTEVTTSFVWHDIGDASFGSYSSANRPTRIEQNMVAGAAVRFPIGGSQNRRLERRYGPKRSTSAVTLAFDYSYLNIGQSKEQYPKHTHVGLNVDLPILSFQVGLNQSSLTFGTSFDIGLFKVDLATYGEELGSYAGQRPDRRYVMSFSTGLGFKGF